MSAGPARGGWLEEQFHVFSRPSRHRKPSQQSETQFCWNCEGLIPPPVPCTRQLSPFFRHCPGGSGGGSGGGGGGGGGGPDGSGHMLCSHLQCPAQQVACAIVSGQAGKWGQSPEVLPTHPCIHPSIHPCIQREFSALIGTISRIVENPDQSIRTIVTITKLVHGAQSVPLLGFFTHAALGGGGAGGCGSGLGGFGLGCGPSKLWNACKSVITSKEHAP